MFAPKAGDQRESGWTGARAARAAGVVAVAAMLAPAGVASAAEVSHGTGHIRHTTQTFAVTTLSDSGPGSLRAAIASADAASGAATEISFSVSGTITLEDLNSSNGTYVNSIDSPRISKVLLRSGDRIYLGRTSQTVLTYLR